MTEVKEKRITEACTILFGEDFTVEQATLEYLQISGIKHAFREKVKQYHPDTSRLSGPDAGENFIKLKDAYDFLVSVKTNTVSSAPVRETYRDNARTIPQRRLRLGEYLFYTGKITWQDLISAITWQRQNSRENKSVPFGFYFVKQGLLSSAELGFATFKMNIHNSSFSGVKK